MDIKFKAKVQTIYNMDDTVAYHYIQVPVLKRNHVNMGQARQHPKYGSYANSDLFLGMLSKIRKDMFGYSGEIKLDSIPEGVTVDTSGFLATVSWKV